MPARWKGLQKHIAKEDDADIRRWMSLKLFGEINETESLVRLRRTNLAAPLSRWFALGTIARVADAAPGRSYYGNVAQHPVQQASCG
jgi:hypothetical protein